MTKDNDTALPDKVWQRFTGMDHDERRKCLHGLTRPQLLDLKSRLQAKKGQIDFQIDEAQRKKHTDGEYADADWYRSVRYASEMTGQQLREVDNTLAARKSAPQERIHEGLLGMIGDKHRETLRDLAFLQALKDVVYEELGGSMAKDLFKQARERIRTDQ